MNAEKRAILSRLCAEHFRQLGAFIAGADDAVRGVGSGAGLPEPARDKQIRDCDRIIDRITARGIAIDAYKFGGCRADVDRAAVLRALTELECVGFVSMDDNLIKPTIRGIETLLRLA